jgi:hypothetical protein
MAGRSTFYVETPYQVYLKHYLSQRGGGGGTYGGMQVYTGPRYQRGNGLGSIFRSIARFITPIFQSDAVKEFGRRAGHRLLDAGLDIGRQALDDPSNLGAAIKMAGRQGMRNIASDALGQVQAAFDPRPPMNQQTGMGIKRRATKRALLLKNLGITWPKKRRKKSKKTKCGKAKKQKRKKRIGGKKKKKRSKKCGKKRGACKKGKKRRKGRKKKKRKKVQKGGKRRAVNFPIFL